MAIVTLLVASAFTITIAANRCPNGGMPLANCEILNGYPVFPDGSLGPHDPARPFLVALGSKTKQPGSPGFGKCANGNLIMLNCSWF